jgi:hypothetical protein
MLLKNQWHLNFCSKSTNIARSNEILGWKGVGNRQLWFFKV